MFARRSHRRRPPARGAPPPAPAQQPPAPAILPLRDRGAGGSLGALGAAGRSWTPSPAAGTAAWPLLQARAAERRSESAVPGGHPAAAAGRGKAASRKWHRGVAPSPPARSHGLPAQLRDRPEPRAPGARPPPLASERRRQSTAAAPPGRGAARWVCPCRLRARRGGVCRRPQLFSRPDRIGLNATVGRAGLTQPCCFKKKKKLLYK